jgi:hypothetical protein
MEKIIERLLEIKSEEEFWFKFHAASILKDFDCRQENEQNKLRIEELEDYIEELETRLEDAE